MRNCNVLLAVLMVLGLALFVSSPAFAVPVYPEVGDWLIVSPGLGSAHGGGEFDVNVVGKGGTLDFITFCLETNEDLWYGTKMYVGGISEEAIGGGVGGKIGTPPNTYDPLDPRTAYLYQNFVRHTLTGFDYTNATDANDLQAAIWYIEQENYGADNKWVTLASNAINSGEWQGLGDVKVINLEWNGGYGGTAHPDGSRAQDILTIPEASPIILLGTALLALAFVGRKRLQRM